MTAQPESNVAFRYDRQHLYKTTTISLNDQEGNNIGTRKLVDEYNKAGQEYAIKSLNSDKVKWEAELSKVKDQLLPLTPEDVDIDEEFVHKVSMAINYGQKKILESKKENVEKTLKDINWELNQVKNAMGLQ